MTQDGKITLVACGITTAMVAAMSARIAYINKWKQKEIEKLTTGDGEFFHFSFSGNEAVQVAAQETLEMLFEQMAQAKTKKSFHKWVGIIKSFKEEMSSCASPHVVVAKYKALYHPTEEPKVVYTVPLV